MKTLKRAPTKKADTLYRRARKSVRPTEDEALNAVCDDRLREPRKPLDKLLKKLDRELGS